MILSKSIQEYISIILIMQQTWL
ncbi:unnamed protein product [Debaryomyces tyrocola]|nr:unnamed protein product [Debaryomyces tyrocola]